MTISDATSRNRNTKYADAASVPPKVLLCGWYRGPKLGIGIYLENLLNALGTLPETSHWTFMTNNNTLSQSDFSVWKGGVVSLQVLDRDIVRTLGFSVFQLPGWAQRRGFDVICMLTNPVCLFSRIPFVSVIHDLNEIEVPGKYGMWRTLYRKRFMLPTAIHNSRRLITVSTTTARQVRKHFGDDSANQTTVINNGVNSTNLSDTEVSDILTEMSLSKGQYYLIPGRIDPAGKNLYKSLELFAELSTRSPEHKLVLIGGVDTFARKEADIFLRDIEENPNWKGRVQYRGFVDERTKSALYSGARAVLFLSRHEGFGLPIVEAFAHGCPVVFNSACEASREIAGEVGIPFDESGNLSDAISRIENSLSDESVRALKPMMASAAARYNWNASARMYVDVITNASKVRH